tara:strand:- start:623 stop:1582 length:960 start_codon:yes stop_codon:yes gene_type:complete
MTYRGDADSVADSDSDLDLDSLTQEELLNDLSRVLTYPGATEKAKFKAAFKLFQLISLQEGIIPRTLFNRLINVIARLKNWDGEDYSLLKLNKSGDIFSIFFLSFLNNFHPEFLTTLFDVPENYKKEHQIEGYENEEIKSIQNKLVKLNTNNLISRDSFVEDFGDIKQLLENFEIKRDKDYINQNIQSCNEEIEKVFSNSNAFEHVKKLSELVSKLSLKEDVPHERFCILQKDYEELNYIFDFVSQNIVILRRFKEELSPDDIYEKRQEFLMRLLEPQMQEMSYSTNYKEMFMKRHYPHIQFFDSLIECYETLRNGVAK